MKIQDGLHEFGGVKCYIKTDPLHMKRRMWVLAKDGIVMFDDGSMTVDTRDESLELSDDDALLVWDESMDDKIFDIFGAIVKGLGGQMDSDRAYEMGRLEGENKILREWNEANMASTPYAPDPAVGPWNPNQQIYPNQPFIYGGGSSDGYKTITAPGTSGGLTYTSNSAGDGPSYQVDDNLVVGLGQDAHTTPYLTLDELTDIATKKMAKNKEKILLDQITGLVE